MGGVSLKEMLMLYELWAGERLSLETVLPEHQWRGRSITVAAASVTAETVIWRSCVFMGAMFRALVHLPAGIRRFIREEVGGSNKSLLRIGWEQCGHGLSCGLKESPSPQVLDFLLVLFGYIRDSSVQLIQGTLKLRYWKRPFARLFLAWKLPAKW